MGKGRDAPSELSCKKLAESLLFSGSFEGASVGVTGLRSSSTGSALQCCRRAGGGTRGVHFSLSHS